MENKLVIENCDRVSVFSGQKKIEDMLVFIAYRKLKRTIAGPASQQAIVHKKDKKE